MGGRTTRRRDLGEFLRVARETADLTQADLSAAIKTTQVSRWERGAAIPSKANAQKLAAVLTCNYDRLLELILDARAEQYEEAVSERDAAGKERDLISKERDELLAEVRELTAALRELLEVLQQRNGGGSSRAVS